VIVISFTVGMVLNETYFPLIQSIAGLSNETDIQNLLHNLEPKPFNSFCQCVREVVNNRGKVRIKRKNFTQLRKALEPVKKEIKSFINPGTSTSTKKAILRQRGGFIGAIIASLLPIIVEQIISATSK